ncbi:anti-sigma factor [Aldersonia kunmingensis]|uniref:anti-sigma factor n=1 Tax=Aldersonia kunmingensis TaxID=408066 RepID=UPI000835ED96|nr:anti-sigma factor [Aldersonia kunmingensis]
MPDDDADENLLDIAPIYALDALTDAERAEVDQALSNADAETAESFAETVAEVTTTMAILSEADAVEPPPAVRERVLAAIRQVRSGTVSDLDQRRRRRTRIWIAAAAAVVIAIAAGVAISQLGTDDADATSQSEILAAPDIQTFTGAITGGGTAVVKLSKDENAAVLSFLDVAEPNTGNVYQVWKMPPTGNPISAGVIEPGQLPDESTGLIIDDLGDATALAFSVEPPGGSPQPTTTPFGLVKFA